MQDPYIAASLISEDRKQATRTYTQLVPKVFCSDRGIQHHNYK
jgi:hypothetical protein